MQDQPPFKLYGSEVSYFTGKVRAYLRWKGLPFEEVPSDAIAFRDVIVPRVGFPVIPVLLTPENDCLQDSTEIIEALERRQPEPSVTPAGPRQQVVSLLLELYGDEWLVIPAMHYRWHHNRDWAIAQFGALSAPDATPEAQQEIGARRAAPFARAAELLGGEPGMHAAIEQSYEALLAELSAHFATHPNLLGSRPGMGDFGLIGPLYAHQYRDPWTGRHMREKAPRVAQWVERMQQPVPHSGEFLAADALPDTLRPVLARMFREQFPVLADSALRVREWMAEHPGDPLPRAIGSHAFTLEGRQGSRIIRPYSLWMLQRARDAFKALAPQDQAAIGDWLRDLGGEAFTAFEDPPRLARHGLSVKPA